MGACQLTVRPLSAHSATAPTRGVKTQNDQVRRDLSPLAAGEGDLP